MTRRLWLCWVALGVLGLPNAALAQRPVVVRAVAASISGTDSIRATTVVGPGLGVELGEYFEVFAEGALAPGVTYPPELRVGGSGSAGVADSISAGFPEWSRCDLLAVGGGRVSTSRAQPVWVFAQAGGGAIRRRDVDLWSHAGRRTSTTNAALVFVGGGVAGRVGRLVLEADYRVGPISDSRRVQGIHVAAGLRF